MKIKIKKVSQEHASNFTIASQYLSKFLCNVRLKWKPNNWKWTVVAELQKPQKNRPATWHFHLLSTPIVPYSHKCTLDKNFTSCWNGRCYISELWPWGRVESRSPSYKTISNYLAKYLAKSFHLRSLYQDYKNEVRKLREDKQELAEQKNFFTKNKELIKEAIEFHLNYASSFSTEHSNPELLDTKDRVVELSLLIDELEEKIKKLDNEQIMDKEEELRIEEEIKEARSEKASLKNTLTNLEKWLKPTNPTLIAFAKQKTKNERIVKECKELLEKLKYYE